MIRYVIARKGVLLSDSSVARMTWGQWLMEYCALRERESLESNRSYELLKNFVDVLKSILGLEFGDKTFPLSYLVGNHKVISRLLEDAANVSSAVNDTEFEAFSTNLLSNINAGKPGIPEGMIPLLTMSDEERAASDLQAQMEALQIPIFEEHKYDEEQKPIPLSDMPVSAKSARRKRGL